MFDWSDSFSVGISEIDNQHCKLFALGRKAYTLLNDDKESDKFVDICKLIGELRAYTMYHFDTEEELFEKYHYPDSGDHIKMHHEFINYLNEIDLRNVDDYQPEALKDILVYISRWIYKHIGETDMKYSSFLIKSMGNDASK